MPRDVEPSAASIEGVTIVTLDAVHEAVDETLSKRQAEVPRVDASGTFWVEPLVVVDIDTHGLGYERLRQPSYQGIRTDLTPEDL